MRPFEKHYSHPYFDLKSCNWETYACKLLTDLINYTKINISDLTKDFKRRFLIDSRRMFTNRQIPKDVHYYTVGNSPNRKDQVSEIQQLI